MFACQTPPRLQVLHGCDHDVVWLQRDFQLYLVNVFDTGQV
jgi:exosome complex exonuclease RRP6